MRSFLHPPLSAPCHHAPESVLVARLILSSAEVLGSAEHGTVPPLETSHLYLRISGVCTLSADVSSGIWLAPKKKHWLLHW